MAEYSITPFQVFSLLLIVTVILTPTFVIFWLRQWLRRRFAQRDAKGRAIRETAMAQTGLANLSPGFGLLARVGEGRAPERSVDRTILRPTLGLRLTSLGLTAMLVFMGYTERDMLLPDSLWVTVAICAALLYAVAFVGFYRLSYDAHEIIAPGALFQRRVIKWTDLAEIRDNGHYLYRLRTHDGRTIDIQKYLVGIRGFLAYALDRLEEQEKAAHARTARGRNGAPWVKPGHGRADHFAR